VKYSKYQLNEPTGHQQLTSEAAPTMAREVMGSG
jgi:hypothetical protein